MSARGQDTTFSIISDVFSRKGVRGALIGGFAVNFYKVSRQTADIDFIISPEDFEKISRLLEEEGFAKKQEQDAFVCFSGNKPYLMDADFMLADEETVNEIVNRGSEVVIAGRKFVIPCLDHLLALKLHSVKHNPGFRESRDLPDIIELIKINGVDPKSCGFKELCLKYGSIELYRKIIEGLKP